MFGLFEISYNLEFNYGFKFWFFIDLHNTLSGTWNIMLKWMFEQLINSSFCNEQVTVMHERQMLDNSYCPQVEQTNLHNSYL